MATAYQQREILAGFETVALHAGADPDPVMDWYISRWDLRTLTI